MEALTNAYRSLRVEDARFAYQRIGEGTPILLLHGWPQTSFAWRRLMPLLAKKHELIAPDLPGFGYSWKPRQGFDKKTIARRLRAFVHALGLSRVAIAGHDLGGHVAYAYAAQWPDEVSDLIFIESSLPCFGQEKEMDVAKGGSWHFGFNMAGDISEALVRGREHLFVEHFLRRETVGVFDAEAVGPAEVDHYARALVRPGALRASFDYYRALPQDRDDNRVWSRTPLAMPVLAVGADWGYGPASAETMRRAAQHVQAVIIERSGHYIPEERPAELAAAIDRFLAGKPHRQVGEDTPFRDGDR